MIITYHGAECFKVSQGNVTLAFNPVSKDSKFKPTRFGADVTLVTTSLPEFNGVEQTSRGDKSSFVIDGPGEYEIMGIFVKGFLSEGPESPGQSGKKINTIYLVTFEDIRICFLGALTNATLPEEIVEGMEEVDILFTPLGEGGTLDPTSAYKLAVSLEPSVIIPMYYTKPSLEEFNKEGGKAKIELLDKFVVKKKDLEDKEGEIVSLKEE